MHLTSAKPSNHNHSHQFTIIVVIIIIVLMTLIAIVMTGLNEEEAQMAGKQLSVLPPDLSPLNRIQAILSMDLSNNIFSQVISHTIQDSSCSV